MKRILFALSVLLFSACYTNFDSSIPDYPVYLELDLTYEDNELNAIQAYKLYLPTSVNQAVERTGYGGVLVYHGLSSTGSSEAYYAFDASCPVECKTTIRVEVDDDAINAVCPNCGTKYEIINGIGHPVEGEGTETLKQYNVNMVGNILYVTN